MLEICPHSRVPCETVILTRAPDWEAFIITVSGASVSPRGLLGWDVLTVSVPPAQGPAVP